MARLFQHISFSQYFKGVCQLIAAILFVLLGACTDESADVPYVLELSALPNSITISDKYFYPKPFSIRAKYSDKTEKNITSRIVWLSENVDLLTINKKGELEKKLIV